jgi:hypothetical protein
MLLLQIANALDAIIERSLTYLEASRSAAATAPASRGAKKPQHKQIQTYPEKQDCQRDLGKAANETQFSKNEEGKMYTNDECRPASDEPAIDTGDVRIFRWVKRHKPCVLTTPAAMAIAAASNAAEGQGKRPRPSWPKPCNLDGAPVNEQQLAAVAVDGQQLADKLAALKQQQRQQGCSKGKAKKLKQQGVVEFGRPFVEHTERMRVLIGQTPSQNAARVLGSDCCWE